MYLQTVPSRIEFRGGSDIVATISDGLIKLQQKQDTIMLSASDHKWLVNVLKDLAEVIQGREKEKNETE